MSNILDITTLDINTLDINTLDINTFDKIHIMPEETP